ncbi:MAG: hypothetical protein IKJ59_06395 [Clostridia bacterium]|nr:hypothetical protein [Clostridia bacterium]
MQSKINKNFNQDRKNQLYNELLKLIGKRKSHSHLHTTLDSLNLVLKHDKIITDLCNQFCISKSLIQAILFDALWSINDQNYETDNLVKKYFDWKQECEDIFTLAPLGCDTIAYPEPPNPVLEDSTTGIGQLSAAIAIAANNAAADNCLINYVKYNENNWQHKKVMWFNLKTNDSFCIKMVILAIRYFAECEEIFGELYDCDKKQLKSIVSRYGKINGKSKSYFNYWYKIYETFKSHY